VRTAVASTCPAVAIAHREGVAVGWRRFYVCLQRSKPAARGRGIA
jgi:hypothetical protein